jgi:dipeptidyl aminopeptidase/acylaminoacyl peptidase
MRTAVEHNDLTLLWDIGQVRLSPDGSRVAIAQTRPDEQSNTYLHQVLLGPVEGQLEQIDADAPASMPRWTPDGRLVVVGRDEDGWSLRLLAPGSAQEWSTVTAGIPDPVEELCVSPDGHWLLFVVREPTNRQWLDTPEDRRPPLRLTTLRYREDGIGWTVNTRRQAYLVPTVGGDRIRLSDGAHDDFHFSWHPDARSVFFVSQRHPRWDVTRLNDVFQMALDVAGAAGEPERLTTTDAEFAWPTCSPDGRQVSFAAVDTLRYPEPFQLAVLDLESRQWRLADPDVDRDTHADAVVWTANDRLATLVDRSGRVELIEFDIPTASHRVLLAGDFRVTDFDTVGGHTVYVRSGVTEPPRLLAGPAGEGGADATETHAPNSEFAATRLLAPAEHRPVQVQEEVTVDSWLVRPTTEAAGPSPLIVWLQGGGTQFGYQWSHEVQLLAAHGFAVLYLNARGSAGYGTDWMRAVNGLRAELPGQGWGVVDIADVAAVVEDTLATFPELDPDRVGVMGGSYGGLVTTHLMAQTDLFRAGWTERGPYNLYSDAGTKDEAPWFFEAYLGGDHRADPESYWQASPLRVAEGITTPLIIVHSENDYRCTIGQAEELFMALKLLGREVEFVRFPGEGHSLTRNGTPVHRLQRSDILTDWFGRHLTG